MILTFLNNYESLKKLNSTLSNNLSWTGGETLPEKEIKLPVFFLRIVKYLPTESFSFAIHGSRASQDFIPFSDIDDLVILRKRLDWPSLIWSAFLLTCIECSMQAADPEQHHGHWLISIKTKSYLEGGYLPKAVMKEAVHIHGINSYLIKDLNSENRGYYKRALKLTSQYVQNQSSIFKSEGLNLYGLKNYVSAVCLLPALNLQCKSIDEGKKAAIKRSLKGNEELRWASAVRVNWPHLVSCYRSRLAYFSFLDPYLGRKLQMRQKPLIFDYPASTTSQRLENSKNQKNEIT